MPAKLAAAQAELADCRACPRDCGVNRLKDEMGMCKVGRKALVSTVAPHHAEEAPLRGWSGSGTVFFSMCNLRCVFCQNWDLSQQRAGFELTGPELADWMLRLQDEGSCHNINFVTPEHCAPQVAEAIASAVERGLTIPIIYNTSSYDALSSLSLMDGLVDIYLPDFKFWTPESSQRYAKAKDYPKRAREAIKEMHRQVGDLVFSPDGLARVSTMRRTVALLVVCLLGCFAARPAICAEECLNEEPPAQYSYAHVFSASRDSGVAFSDLPGYSRSVYAEDHALLTPESRVWAPNTYGWTNSLTAHLITPAKGAHFTMYLVQMQKGGKASQLANTVERFVFVVEGEVQVKHGGKTLKLSANDYVYFPPGSSDTLTSDGAGLCIYERVYAKKGKPQFQHGTTDDKPLLPVEPEVFGLRKLMPATDEYDFNIHVMDFKPGQYLYIKEIHYNQHGLLLLQGQGIYRLANNWYPVQAGDAIWMPPFVLQWYAALGTENTRYLLYKDTAMDPLLSP